MSSVKVSDITRVITEEVNKYADTCVDDLRKIANEVAKEGVVKLKNTSPKSGKNTRHYKDGWGITATYEGGRKFSFTVHNKTKPGLTHLLENGHALRNGGRAKAFPHIRDVEEWCVEEYEKRVERMLNG